MGKVCDVTGKVLWLGAAAALIACTSPTYSGDRDAAASDPSDPDHVPGSRDASDGKVTPSRDAGLPRPSDTSSDAAPPREGDRDGSSATSNIQPDGGASVTMVSSEPLPDAGMTTSSTVLPSWAPKLLGKYAIVLYSFTDDGLVRSAARDVGLMDIAAGSNGYEALLSHCQSFSGSTGGSGSAMVVKPASLPPRRFQLVFGTDTFVAKPLDFAVGYEQGPPPSCEGHLGELVDKRDFQTWISGSKCRCSDEAPPKVDDCRVLDPDGDKRPGYTVLFRTLSASTEVYGVTESRSSIVQGHAADNGAHTALFQVNDVVAQYGCDPAGCANVSGASMACDTVNNQVLFASLERAVMPAGGWSCTSVLDLFSTLFPNPAPTFPARCRTK